MGFFIVVANVIGYILYKKKQNLYSGAFAILLSAGLFGGMGGILALFVIRDPFAIFYGLQVGYFLLINSAIAFIIAIIVTVIKRYNNQTA